MALNRLGEAWQVAAAVKNKELYQSIALKALDQLDIELAIRIYRELHDVGMVSSLQLVANQEDKMWLSAYISMLQGQFNEAQVCF